jgi:hypothetical protein
MEVKVQAYLIFSLQEVKVKQDVNGKGISQCSALNLVFSHFFSISFSFSQVSQDSSTHLVLDIAASREQTWLGFQEINVLTKLGD